MASLRKALLAGVAAIGIGVAGAASAQNVHVDECAGSGRRVAQIRYVGEVPPQIVFVPAPAAFDPWMPVSSIFGPRFAVRDARPDRGRDGPARGGDVPLRRGNGRPRRCRRVAEAAIRGDAAGRPELFLCLDDFRQRRMHAERPDHVARRRDRRVSSGTAPGIAAGGRADRRAGRGFSRRLRSLSAAAEAARSDPDAEQRPSPYAGMVRQVASAAR